jgi:opacity protein-like surface antigen
MKKNILLHLTSLLFFIAADAQAQELCAENSCCAEDSCCVDETNFYAKILGGANFLRNTAIEGNKSTYQTGYIIAGSVGYCWGYGLRLEGEYAFRRNAIRKIQFVGEGFSKDGHFQTSSYMVNLSTWGSTFWNIKPFVGAGIGYDFEQMHSSNSRIVFNQKWNKFAWQLMAGLAFPIFCNTEIALEYKFHQGGCFYNHSIGVGLVYKFGFLKSGAKPDRIEESHKTSLLYLGD